ncbi:MAG: hypothetical protein KAT77_04815 [Nanoarchaeota archaeon]|nr:hypothetical protein [Nanoarchaeota archaeon]
MKGLNRITEKIQKDAEQEANKIKKEKEEIIKDIKDKNKKIIQSEEKILKKQMEMHLELLESKTLSRARLDAKNKVLKNREDMIQKILKDVQKDLEKNFDKLIENRLQEYPDQEITVVCSSKNKKLVEKAAPHAKIETQDIEGVIIKQGEGKLVKIQIEDEINQLMPEVRKVIGGLIK